MLLIGKKKKKRITAYLGFLWHYIKQIDDVGEFAIATDIFTIDSASPQGRDITWTPSAITLCCRRS